METKQFDTHRFFAQKSLSSCDKKPMSESASSTFPLEGDFQKSSDDPVPTANAHKRKIERTRFSIYQKVALENSFLSSLYLTGVERDNLAFKLGLSPVTVQTWFKNRRFKWRKELKMANGTHPEPVMSPSPLLVFPNPPPRTYREPFLGLEHQQHERSPCRCCTITTSCMLYSGNTQWCN
ncbi:retina and anterior neural fold homeobox protein 2-like [Pocillopora verrucosa]|uniref:retina and anterior neural fold homeobox protein 2-like n=1 Tax=Pocillopora verrucosa TaxID=203993 RepID=UPI003342B357